MKLVVVLQKNENLSSLKQNQVQEVIFAVQGYSRVPIFEKDEAYKMAKQCLAEGLRPLLEWDILMTDLVFEKTTHELSFDFIDIFSAVRIQDLGGLNFLRKKFPQKNIQIILEHGNHNFVSLQAFTQVHPRIERLILSPQIPGNLLKKYAQNLKCPIEVLYQGPLFLSYSPRPLLSRLGENDVEIKSLEGQPHELHAIENNHGTIIFHSLRFSLEKRREELESWENCFFRVDTRLDKVSHGTTEGFFERNESSEVFVHLKNSLIERRDGDYLGEVVDVVRERFIGICLAHPHRTLKIGDWLVFQTPEGRIKEQQVTELCNFLLESVDEGKNGDVIFIPHKGVVSVRSSVYFKA